MTGRSTDTYVDRNDAPRHLATSTEAQPVGRVFWKPEDITTGLRHGIQGFPVAVGFGLRREERPCGEPNSPSLTWRKPLLFTITVDWGHGLGSGNKEYLYLHDLQPIIARFQAPGPSPRIRGSCPRSPPAAAESEVAPGARALKARDFRDGGHKELFCIKE